MRKRRGSHGGYWQSYADLAMGLMSVLVFVLILLLARQGETNRELAEAQKSQAAQLAELKEQRLAQESVLSEVKEQRASLVGERREFAVELMQLIDSTWSLVERQDNAERWLRALFSDSGCRLVLSELGGLEFTDASGHLNSAANLYGSGDVSLSPAGEAALASCRANFVRLAACLSPPGPGRAAPQCTGKNGAAPADAERRVLEELRNGLDGLIVEGSTDRFPFGVSLPVANADKIPAEATQLIQNYASNSFLGSERGRRAVVFLASLVAQRGTGDYEPLSVFLSRIRIESSSFSRYQVGPPEWREGDCDPGVPACDAARNLAFRVQWKKSELRRPYEEIRKAICRRLADPEDPFARGLVEAGHDLGDARRRYDCEAHP